jgi:glycosyltransferase involved in cell wall biosynthesis
MMATNGKPRLCHVVTSPADRFGPLVRVRREAAITCEAGFAVDLISGWGADPQLVNAEQVAQVDYFRLPHLSKYIYPHKDFLALLSLYRLFRQRRYRVVHTHFAKAGVLGRIAAGLARVPVIMHSVYGPSFSPFHSWQHRSLFLTMEKLAGRHTTHYLFTANHMRDSFDRHGIGPRAEKAVIHPGVDFSPFAAAERLSPAERARLRRELGVNPDDLIVGYVSRIVPAKGHTLAIRALHHLSRSHPRIKLYFVGGAVWPEEQKHLAALKELIQELGLTEKVIFAGHQAQTIPFYQSFDAFVFPSLHEGIGMAVFEALFLGLPVVAFDIPSMREFFPQAVIAPYGDAAGLAQTLEKVLNGPKTAGFNQLEKDQVLQKFSTARWRAELLQYYNNIFQSIAS